MHPYEMQQVVRERCTDYVVKVRAGSLYHTIERLHGLGLIEPVETGRDGRRPERTVYAVTDIGRDEYRLNLHDLVRYPEDEYPVFGAAIEMLATLPATEAARLLEQRVTAVEAELAAYDQVATSLAKRGIPRANTVEIEYAQAMRRAELAWIRQTVDDIRSGDLAWTQEPTDETTKELPS